MYFECVDGYTKTDNQCVVIEYKVTYNLNNGINDANNPTSYTIVSNNITLNPATRDGYIFMGWYDNAEFTGNPVT
jgi:hypothetical protein